MHPYPAPGRNHCVEVSNNNRQKLDAYINIVNMLNTFLYIILQTIDMGFISGYRLLQKIGQNFF